MSSPNSPNTSLPTAAVIIAALALAIILIKLGALSVWVTVLMLMLKFMAALLIGFVLFLIWQRIYRRKP